MEDQMGMFAMNILDERVKTRYHIHIQSKKKGFLKLENENYPIIDKVFSILNA